MVYSICSSSGYLMYVLYVILLSSWTQMHYGTHSCIGILWDWLVLNQWPVWTFSLSLSLSARQWRMSTLNTVKPIYLMYQILPFEYPELLCPSHMRDLWCNVTHILTLSQSQCRMLKASKYFDITYENSIWLPSGIRFVFIGEERARHDTDISLNNTIIQIHALITGSKVLFTKTT